MECKSPIPDLSIPTRFTLNLDGTFELVPQAQRLAYALVAHALVLITKRPQDSDDGPEHLELLDREALSRQDGRRDLSPADAAGVNARR